MPRLAFLVFIVFGLYHADIVASVQASRDGSAPGSVRSYCAKVLVKKPYPSGPCVH